MEGPNRTCDVAVYDLKGSGESVAVAKTAAPLLGARQECELQVGGRAGGRAGHCCWHFPATLRRLLQDNSISALPVPASLFEFPLGAGCPLLPCSALLQAKENMLFAGTGIASGACLGVVNSIGMDTEIGKIQEQIQVGAGAAPQPGEGSRGGASLRLRGCDMAVSSLAGTAGTCTPAGRQHPAARAAALSCRCTAAVPRCRRRARRRATPP